MFESTKALVDFTLQVVPNRPSVPEDDRSFRSWLPKRIYTRSNSTISCKKSEKAKVPRSSTTTAPRSPSLNTNYRRTARWHRWT